MPAEATLPIDRGQAYPPLPAGTPPAEESAANKAQYITFLFPGAAHFTAPWMRLLGADYQEGKKLRLRFKFADMFAYVSFPHPERESPIPYWQSFQDGRLTTIEHRKDLCEIKLYFVANPEWASAYDPEAGGDLLETAADPSKSGQNGQGADGGDGPDDEELDDSELP